MCLWVRGCVDGLVVLMGFFVVCLFLYVRTYSVIVGDSEENAEKKVWDEKFAKKCHILSVYDFPFYLELHECGAAHSICIGRPWAPHSHSIWVLTRKCRFFPIFSIIMPYPSSLCFHSVWCSFHVGGSQKNRAFIPFKWFPILSVCHECEMAHSICISKVWGDPFYL
jgi:hypothetical protein